MKDTYFLYTVAILAVLSILICFIGYATDRLPMSTPRQQTSVVMPTSKEKSCACCSKNKKLVEKRVQQVLEHWRRQQQRIVEEIRSTK